MFDAEVAAGGGKVFRAVGRAAIGQDALDFDVVQSVKVDGLMQRVEDALDLFVWEEAGEGQAGMIIDSDVETFDSGPWIAHSAIACRANARTAEAAQFLDVEMEELAWGERVHSGRWQVAVPERPDGGGRAGAECGRWWPWRP